jgi:6-phosphogluconolactonase
VALIVDDAGAIVRKLTRALVSLARSVIEERGEFRVALSGGSTPRPVYAALALQPDLAWEKWRIFFSDERCVPPDDAQSNYRLARETLLEHVPIPPDRVHRMRGELDESEAARLYEAELGLGPLDLALLGMGQDGHTASLFPGSPALEERGRLVVPSLAPVEPRRRLTLTLRALDGARAAWFFICGENKAARLAEVVAERRRGEPELPAARVDASTVDFYADTAAASKVRQP